MDGEKLFSVCVTIILTVFLIGAFITGDRSCNRETAGRVKCIENGKPPLECAKVFQQ